MSPVTLVDKTATTYVAGHRGLAGSAIWRRLAADGWTDLVGRTRAEVDLLDRAAVDAFFDAVRPTTVVVAAAKVGGIGANVAQPYEFLSENLRLQVNLLDAALRTGVDRLLFLGSSCAYPRLAPQPMSEDYLLDGRLEPTNEGYALAKVAGLVQVAAARHQYGRRWISALPCNLYGPGDDFSTGRSHVLAAMVRRYVEAHEQGLEQIVCWGSGRPRREFMHVDDLADAVAFLLEHYDDDPPVNVGTGCDLTVAEIAATVAGAVGYRGTTGWDTTKPDGMPRKLLDVSRLTGLGWRASVPFADGVASTVEWYRSHRDSSPPRGR
ncbi:MAG: GDP-L-fucose synthase [Micrococcales bacterium]|nr:GDP-L-fucose synthase [Micrococcales bacterium]